VPSHNHAIPSGW